MNRYTDFYKRALLAVAVITLNGGLALADEPTVAGTHPANTNIIVAKATPPAKTDSKTESLQDDQDKAIAEAIESVMEDNKLQLDLRLSGHKSMILAAD